MNFYTYAKHFGNKILVRGVKNGERFTASHDFKPTLFVKSDKQTGFKSIYGETVSPIKFETNKEAQEFVERYKEVANFPIYGQTYWCYQYIAEKYPDTIEWDAKHIRIYSMDIETTANSGFPSVDNPTDEVLLISLQENTTKKITTFGVGPFTVGEHTKDYDIDYIECSTEIELLNKFLDWWQQNTPDVLTGWNIQLFDVPYLVSRVEAIMGDEAKKRFSPFDIVQRRNVNIQGKKHTTINIEGVSQLDYLDLYRKFTYVTRESYKLDFIAEVELGKSKLEHGYDTFKEQYEQDWNGFVEYNIVDTVLVDELEDKMKLIELALTMTYDGKMNFNDVFSPVRTWDCLLYNHLKEQNITIPTKGTGRQGRQIAGAYVQEPVPGEYEWVASFDATSLYPSIIMQYNMSPETLVPGYKLDVAIKDLLTYGHDLDKIRDNNYAMAANGHCYTRTRKGHFPTIVQKFFDDRLKYKKLMQEAQQKFNDTGADVYKKEIARYNNFQMARKIQLNSLYGALANEYFRYYDDRIAEGITLTGQYIIQASANALDVFLNKVCGTNNEVKYNFYSDTDSCYITLKNVVDYYYKDKSKDKVIDILDKIGQEQIEPCIDKAMHKLARYTNAFEEKIFFKREVIADKGIWVAKKRYALNVYDNEGVRYKEPKLKVMGLEIVRSSTPGPIRDSLREAVRIVLTQDEQALQEYIRKAKQDFLQMSPEKIAFPRGCNNLQKYRSSADIYEKGTPIHVRSALLFNKYIKENGLQNKYEQIQEGDKIKFVYLKEPNTIGENVVGFINKLPEEFNLHSYVDYDTIFQKAFIEPITSIIDSVGWKTEPQATLEDLFA